MNQVVTIGLDIAKSVFQVHGVDSEGAVVLRQRLTRSRLLAFFAKRAPCLVGLEACGSAHHWGRELSRLGHEVRLIPPSYVKPYVKRQKNDAADAEAICEAVTRPSMRFVPIKSPEQQSIMVAHRTRSILTRQRTQLSNAIRGHMSEFGLVAPIGRNGLEVLIAMIADVGDDRVPKEARACLLMLVAQLRLVVEQILQSDRCIIASARSTEVGRRLMGIPGVGPVLASALVAAIADPQAFRSGRNLAAWIGLVPRQNSSGGKERLKTALEDGLRVVFLCVPHRAIEPVRAEREMQGRIALINVPDWRGDELGEIWDEVQTLRNRNAKQPRRLTSGAKLIGKLFDDRGNAMTPTSVHKGTTRYRYYVSSALTCGARTSAASAAFQCQRLKMPSSLRWRPYAWAHRFAPSVAKPPSELAEWLGNFASPLGMAFTFVDYALVFWVASYCGAGSSSARVRALQFIAYFGGSILVAGLLPPPWGLPGVAMALAGIFGLNRKWAWVEEDRRSYMLSGSYDFRRNSNLSVGFEGDYRGVALTALALVIVVMPLALLQCRPFGFFELKTGGDVRSLAPYEWFIFFGGELAKSVPFVDWSEVYGAQTVTPLQVVRGGGQHVVFFIRAVVDLVLLSGFVQVLELSSRLARQEANFRDEDNPERLLDPFVERDAFRDVAKFVAPANENLLDDTLIERIPSRLGPFTRYSNQQIQRVLRLGRLLHFGGQTTRPPWQSFCLTATPMQARRNTSCG